MSLSPCDTRTYHGSKVLPTRDASGRHHKRNMPQSRSVRTSSGNTTCEDRLQCDVKWKAGLGMRAIVLSHVIVTCKLCGSTEEGRPKDLNRRYK